MRSMDAWLISNSIIQRTGVVPMSIAGIAKEVTTISISAWFFGDQLTPLNIVGVAITVCGALQPGEFERWTSVC